MESMNSSFDSMNLKTQNIQNDSTQESSSNVPYHAQKLDIINNWWAMLALVLVLGTAAGNILVCLAIAWERRLQNVTNYFLMSLAITDLMVAILVMPLGILTLVRGYFPLPAMYCLVWICLDVLFCTASIMHLCTISVDRFLSLRYPMKFGRNKTRKRVILKIVFVWLLSIAMSLPLCLMYSKDDDSVLVDGTCQIPDPWYKLIGSIICFFIPLVVMLITYALTVKLLAKKKENMGGDSQGNRQHIQRKQLVSKTFEGCTGTPLHTSAASTDTELTILDTHDLWLPKNEPQPPSLAMSALHEFGTEILKLSKGLEGITNIGDESLLKLTRDEKSTGDTDSSLKLSMETTQNEHLPSTSWKYRPRAFTYETYLQNKNTSTLDVLKKRSFSFHEQIVLRSPSIQRSTTHHLREETDKIFVNLEELTPSSSCTYHFKDFLKNATPETINKIQNDRPSVKNRDLSFLTTSDTNENKYYECSRTVVTWRNGRRGSNSGSTRTFVASSKSMPLRRAVTMRAHNSAINLPSKDSSWSPSVNKYSGLIRSFDTRTSSMISRNSSRHGRIIRLEQKATKVLGVVFFTFVILWAPFFILNLIPVICSKCENQIDHNIFDLVTWLGYASSTVNPIFYTIFNKTFRQAFKKIIFCGYGTDSWRLYN